MKFLASTTAIAEVEAEFSAGLCELMSLSQQLLQLQPQVLHQLMHKHTNKTNKNEVVVISSPKLRAPSPDIPCEEPSYSAGESSQLEQHDGENLQIEKSNSSLS